MNKQTCLVVIHIVLKSLRFYNQDNRLISRLLESQMNRPHTISLVYKLPAFSLTVCD